jgi:hypothetical protein
VLAVRGGLRDDPSLTAARRSRRLALDPNEKTQYRARALKSIHITTTVGRRRPCGALTARRGAQALVMKLVLHECHVNGQNLFNQATRRSPRPGRKLRRAVRRWASWA